MGKLKNSPWSKLILVVVFLAAIFFVLIFLTFWFFIRTKMRLDRWEAGLLLVFYLIFVAIVFI